jgi:hypothetical protein
MGVGSALAGVDGSVDCGGTLDGVAGAAVGSLEAATVGVAAADGVAAAVGAALGTVEVAGWMVGAVVAAGLAHAASTSATASSPNGVRSLTVNLLLWRGG